MTNQTVKQYRCKHAVEAMQWTGERESLSAWHEQLTGRPATFLENLVEPGAASVLLDDERLEWQTVKLGEWLVRSDGEFLVMDNEMFTDEYEER